MQADNRHADHITLYSPGGKVKIN